MPWKETCAMDERMEFVFLLKRGEESLSAVWGQSPDGLQVVAKIYSGGRGGFTRSASCAPALSAQRAWGD